MKLQLPDTAEQRLNAAVVLLTIAMCSWLFVHLSTDYDLWGHLKFGLDYIAAGRLPITDSYSYIAAGHTWFSHSWLFELLTAAVYLAGGSTGISLLKFVLSMSICLLLLARLIRGGVSPIAACAMTLLAAMGLAHNLMPLRPQLATFLLFTTELLVLQAAAKGSAKQLFWLPPLFVLWCNLHGGFVAGMLMLLIWSGLRLMELLVKEEAQARSESMMVVTASVLSVVATLINPYGWRLWVFLGSTLLLPRPEITEWLPLKLTSADGLNYLCVLLVTAGPLILSARRRQPTALTDCGLYLAALVLPFLAVRHLPLFIITAVICSSDSLKNWRQTGTQDKRELPARQAALGNKLSVFMAVVAIGLLVLTSGQFSKISVGADMPASAVGFLKAHHATGHLATHFDWGEYCIFHLFPAVQVSFDGRREEVYSPAEQQLNIDFSYGLDNNWAELLKRYPTDMVLVPKNFPVYARMRTLPDWPEVYSDSGCGLFVHSGSDVRRQLSGGDTFNRPAIPRSTNPAPPQTPEEMKFP